MPARLLDRVTVWALKQNPPIRKREAALVELVKRGLKAK